MLPTADENLPKSKCPKKIYQSHQDILLLPIEPTFNPNAIFLMGLQRLDPSDL